MKRRDQPRDVEPWRQLAFERGLTDAEGPGTRKTRAVRRQLRVTDQGIEVTEESITIEERDNWR